jgi:hypothetical protein
MVAAPCAECADARCGGATRGGPAGCPRLRRALRATHWRAAAAVDNLDPRPVLTTHRHVRRAECGVHSVRQNQGVSDAVFQARTFEP